MHCCEFCHNQFTPRNQVKNPRACFTKKCQTLRQRDNEKVWKQKHLDQYDNEYHEIQREKRALELEDILKLILDYIKAGARLFGKKIEFEVFNAHLTSFFLRLGIRQINKFWNIEKASNISDMEVTKT